MKHGKSVAIVGVGGIFPKAPTLDRFWANITEKVNTARRPPAGRWLLNPEQIYDPAVGAADKVYSEKACFIEESLADLCLDGLEIPAEFLAQLDPMFHLLLHAGRQAFLDGGSQTLAKDRVGAIIGNLALPSEQSSALARDYLGRTFEEQQFGKNLQPEGLPAAPINRYVAGLPAGILARALGIKGTCFTLDAACASSLYAIKLAVDELVANRADAMLAGGLSRPDSLYTQMGFSQLHALSPSGTCSPFDDKGDGLVVGEGSGMFLLKRTEDAVRDKDHIYAVIRGLGLSNDLGGSLLAPASEGQLRAMRAAYRQAGWSPADVDLVECHATGTPVGDAVEFKSLQSLWGDAGWKEGQCVIGSVKSNIGHLLTAAGAAALMKTILALQEKTLPPTANFSRPAAGISYLQSPFRVLGEPAPWSARSNGAPRRAAVSAFGFGGINAHLLIEEWQPRKATKSSVTFPPSFQRQNQPVAIVGMGAHFGPWASLEEFQYRVLGNARDCPPTAPSNWWGAEQSQWFRRAGLDKVKFRGHFVAEAASAPGEFRIPPKELEEMLPRQLLMLKVAGEAMRDAGLDKEDLLFTGVYVGTGLDLNATNFSLRWSIQALAPLWARQLDLDLTPQQLAEWTARLRDAAGPPLTANRTMGALGSIVASRIAKEFRIGGPSFTLSSEENSGLRALEVGIRALQEGSINRAVIGAVDMAGDLRSVLGRHALQPYSSSGCARPFDKRADGSIIGEGAAAVVLKRLEDAQQDGDRIYAVIRGMGTAIGGRSDGFAPDGKTYVTALQKTFRDSGVSPAEVTYLETAGDATAAEDRLEANALGDFFGADPNETPCYVGSVKADIGHAGAASGLAALIKAALCLDRQIIPPLRQVASVRYEWIRGKRDFIVPGAAQYWLRNRADGPRRAVVSGFAVDGSCSHALLEGFEDKKQLRSSALLDQPLGPRSEALFCLEADDVDGLLTQVSRLTGFLENPPVDEIEALAAAWLKETGSDSARKLCIALIAADSDMLAEQLAQALSSLKTDPGRPIGFNDSVKLSAGLRDRVFYAPRPLGHEGKTAFIFPGSGNHFAGMGRDLSAQWPRIYRQQDAGSHFLARQFLPGHFWKPTLADSLHTDHNALVIGQVALGTAVSDLVRSFGIEPQAVSGYSLGEAAGLFALGAWTDRDGMTGRLEKSSLFVNELAGECRAAARAWKLKPKQQVDWALGLVAVPERDVRHAMTGLDRVYLLIINTYAECVVGGDRRQLEQLVDRLGCHLLPLKGVTTVHCKVVEPVAKAYRDLHLFPVTAPPGVDFYSAARGDRYQVTDQSAADSILAQALDTVDYTQVIEKLHEDGVRIFLEMGPGNSCSRMINSILDDRPHLARAACVPGQDAVSLLLRLLGQCLAARLPVDLASLYPPERLPVSPTSFPNRIHAVIGAARFPEVGIPARTPVTPPLPAAEGTVAGRRRAQPGRVARPMVAPNKTAMASRDSALAQFEQLSRKNLEAHAAYLNFSETLGRVISENMSLQMGLLEKMTAAGIDLSPLRMPDLAQAEPESAAALPSRPGETGLTAQPLPAHHTVPAFGREMCMEFAIGSIAKMLGPGFAEVDTHPTRVRLPDEPLMLVDRIVAVDGEPRSMTGGRVVTEHDVTADRWYLDGGRIPTCIAVEAGQADLFLSGYLGIDFKTRGLAVYRLLDAVVTFHRSLPVPGDVIRYDIRIDHFFRQDQTYLFRFHFEGTVNGEPLLSMKNGCAGFFTAAELAAGQGIVQTRLDLQPQPGIRPDDWRDLAPMARESYDEGQIAALYKGDLASCFGPAFTRLDLQRPYTLPGGKLKLVDRVVELDPQGGRYGLGQIRAEMDIHPDDWFLTCHFCDDNVMPGTLMYECCMHTLRIYLLRMGWIGEEGATWCEPVPGVDSGLKCRGQVIETTCTVTYQVSIKELGYGPEPFAIVDALMFADGKPIVEIPNMSVRLAGLDREQVEVLWTHPPTDKEDALTRPSPRGPCPVRYDYDKILAFSAGNPSEAFGEPYRIFDSERRIARLPRPPFQFLDRIVDVTGEPFKLVEGATCVAAYDVPADGWYFEADRQPEMPFSILLETGLQPCGWLAAYLGSALTSDIDLKFRNLDGNAVQHRPVTPDSGTLTTRVRITRISSSGGMIIQGYDFEISDLEGPVYSGDTVFGFFSAQSLAQQVGIRDARLYEPSAEEAARAERFDYPAEAPFPARKLRMVDRIDLCVNDGGPHGLGFIRGSKDVDQTEWFFKAHFYQDPVCPGSLGLESLLQLLKVVAARRWGADQNSRFGCAAPGETHSWNYRGQIVPDNGKVVIEAVITAVDDGARLLRADGLLAVDGRIIYRMKDFMLSLSTS